MLVSCFPPVHFSRQILFDLSKALQRVQTLLFQCQVPFYRRRVPAYGRWPKLTQKPTNVFDLTHTRTHARTQAHTLTLTHARTDKYKHTNSNTRFYRFGT